MDSIILFQDGLVLFFNTFFIETRFAIVLAFLFIAVIFDIRSHRIPNWLVFSGALVGIAYQALSPFDKSMLYSLAGLSVGLAAFMPLYMLRAMGAGDVKLMAMVGAFLGPASTVGAVLTTFIAGGILAIAAAVRHGALQTLSANLRFMLVDLRMRAMTGSVGQVKVQHASAGKLPYALAIGAGSAAHIFLLQRGQAIFS